MTKGRRTFQPLTSKNVCEIYELLHKEGIVSFPLTPEAEKKVDALIANITGKSFGLDHYPTIEQKVVAYFYFLIKNHPFTDGNKRTATLSFLVLCELNDVEVMVSGVSLDMLAVFLEQSDPNDHQNTIGMIANTFVRVK